ncbi:MAG: vitamin K epoxide reductase family protein [Deltaproteobacteria bacterium]|nr:MAG: vitamin K epoxide reductase family protein [Deltaproteobacteria bacterium]
MMAKPARKKSAGKKQASQQIPVRVVPNWPLFGLALVGMGLTAYLTITTWKGQALAGCAAGSGCDVVLSSRWSELFGLPTSLWGFLAYSSLAAIAWIKRVDAHWKLAWIVALFGVLYSGYLTSVSLIELNAACPYCLTSAALFSVILVTVVFQRPVDLSKFSWPSWLAKTLTAGAVVVLALHLHYAGIWGRSLGPEDPQLRALAENLARTEAKFYGAYWCPHCLEQKRIFGSSASRLPYIECSPLGPNTRQASVCEASRIETYPTWIINGQRYVGVQSPEELARYSGFKGALP